MKDRKGRQTLKLIAVCAVVVFYSLMGLALVERAAAFGPYPGCQPETYHPDWSPTEIKGCIVYGVGTASRWQGPGVARNDCVYPWTDCTTIEITNIDPRSQGYQTRIVVVPKMFCDCFTGTSDERIVDLGPAAVAALGLDPDQGLYPVSVEPVGGEHGSPPALPNTAMEE